MYVYFLPTLDSGNLKESYDNRVETFLSTWQSDMENIRATFFTLSNEKGCNTKRKQQYTVLIRPFRNLHFFI